MSDQKITPCLWFDFKAEEAVADYLAVFDGGRLLSTSRYGEAGPGPRSAVMTILFEIDGQKICASTVAPNSPSLRLSRSWSTARLRYEVDRIWDGLCDGGKPGQCGWLTDKFGVSWQIVPSIVARIMQTGDTASIERVMQAVMPMKKLDIATLQRAYEGK